MRRYLSLLLLALVALTSLFAYQYFIFHDGKLHIYICNVGQGDGIFIRTPKGEDVIIDGGPDDKILSCLSSHMPFWDRTIENIFMTHPDADHSTGLTYVLERYKVNSFNTEKVPGKTLIFKKLVGDLAEKHMTARYLYRGNQLSEGDLLFKTVWPTHEAVQRIEAVFASSNVSLNELSVTEVVQYKNFKALFTGDESAQVGDQVASVVGKIDVLKVPHHGSRFGMDFSYLSVLRPTLAVVSVGAKNRYGHPAPSSLDLLQKAGVKTLRTDTDGEVEIISDGSSFTYSTH